MSACKPSLALLLVLPLGAQSLPISISYQGDDSFSLIFNRKRPKTQGLVKTITCNPGDAVVHLPTPLVDQQIEASGMPVIARSVVVRSILKVEQRDWRSIALKVTEVAAFAATIVVANSATANSSWRIGAPAASVAIQQLNALVRKEIPISGVEALSADLLADQILLEPGGCRELLRLVRWSNNYPPIVQGTITLAAKGTLEPIAPSKNLTCIAGSPCVERK